MAASNGPTRQLPATPSLEHLRKQAKRLAKAQSLTLAAAQRQLAASYGFPDWTALLKAVSQPERPAPTHSALSEAAAKGDGDAVRELLARGDSVEGTRGESNTPLWYACDSMVPDAQKIAVVTLLLDAGASPRRHCQDNVTPFHVAARRGPLALLELMIRRGALTWPPDNRGRDALAYARKGNAREKAEIVMLLDRPVIRDPNFRAAVKALHAGDVAALSRLLDAHPNLLHDRAIEPDCYPPGYFNDPKLFWFIANNPNLRRRVAPRIVESTSAMIERGVEKSDLDYTLMLVMTNGQAKPADHQAELIAMLLAAGATPTQDAIVSTLAHWQLDPVRQLLEGGMPLTASIAASMGRIDDLKALLKTAVAAERQEAFGLAVINRQLDAARLCLEAGADANQFLPVHKHSLPMHQAAIDENIDMMKLLVAHGARHDQVDKLWDSTPLGWAMHNDKRHAVAYLQSLQDGKN